MVDAREMKKILRNNGYEYQRCKGSHFMYSNGIYTVAVNKDLNAMVAKSGLSTLFQTNFFRLFFRYCTGV